MIVTKYYEALNLKANPFALTPDVSMFFLMQSHREAFDTVLFSLDNGVPMVRIYGDPGTGKTMLLRYLEDRLTADREVFCKYVSYNVMMDHYAFLKSLFSVEVSGFDDASLRACLSEVLSKGDYVLLIDEAQDMQLPQFALLKHLLDESASGLYGGRLFVVCAGTLKLEKLFESEDFKPLAQRAPYHFRLYGLKKDEVGAYIEFRLRQSGFAGEMPFTRWALRRIWKTTNGNPRKVNILAERAMLAAMVRGKRRAGWREVKEAERDLPKDL